MSALNDNRKSWPKLNIYIYNKLPVTQLNEQTGSKPTHRKSGTFM